MYRILLQLTPATSTRPATFQWINSGATPWSTENEQEGLERYIEELNNYKRSALTLVNTIDVKLTAENTANIDEIEEITSGSFVLHVNDGTNFTLLFNMEDENYVPVFIDEDLADTVVDQLMGLDLTNVNITPAGITADNSTGTPISGTVQFPQKLIRLYSQSSRRDNYLSSSVTVTL